ncbi:ATP-binding protein [Bradyrhizobium sp. CCGUVB23]|uniref:ATP-binding protein n=1 Tax=Bradyrhizobium sp. CCGUVB23 TaxID=2949630 RepID=UPI0020B27258|nr:ATP-binding protein [Bradyrhizobium sp. CCGUVB23]MCP3463491.1 ATP-binding protein [Bradyrhizobium sp. CCGUVB23]
MIAPTLLGHVGAVSGAAISVRQFEGVASGIAIIGGRSYRVGQVGSFVRIPQGYHDLYGIIAEVGATATPEAAENLSSRGERWITVQLVGEIVETAFERGISQYPAINDEVHLVTEEDLARIYGIAEEGQVVIGSLAGAESIPVHVDLDRLVTRHSAVLGSTGSGKSTTIASLLRAIVHSPDGSSNFPSTRILLLDIHGEYATSLKKIAHVFRVSPAEDEKPLFIPYWATDTTEMLAFMMGKLSDPAFAAITDKILSKKLQLAKGGKYDGIDVNSLTFDTPLPFSLKQLWFDLIDPEIKTWNENTQLTSAIEKPGNAEKLVHPVYPLPGPGGAKPFANKTGVLSVRRQLDQMRSRLLDRQYDFMLHPGDWEPALNDEAKKDLPELLESWLGADKPISILDLSGIPSGVLHHLVGGILNILYEALFWGREAGEGGRQRPLLVVMEEAHRYLGKDADGPAKAMVQRIVKEGRKFGVGAMIVSQRPSEIDDTILSQCGTFIALRLSNTGDRGKVQSALPDSLSGLMDSLPVLRTGEAIITGEAAKLPIRCRITLPPEGARPSSEDPSVSQAWAKPKAQEDYVNLSGPWRAQNPKWKRSKKGK